MPKRVDGRIALVATITAAALAVPATASAAPAFQNIGSSGGPLTKVDVATDLSCQVEHTGDSTLELYPPAAEPGDCGTFLVQKSTDTLYAPDFGNHDGTATGGLGTTTPFTGVSQSGVTGSGTSGDPRKVVTVAKAGSDFTMTETDAYVDGSESYHSDVTVHNDSGSAQDVILYRAGDCYLQDSDEGFGFTGPNGAVGCSANANNDPPDRIEEWVPSTGGSHFTEDDYSTVWEQIGNHTDFPDMCAECTINDDNGAGLSWAFNVAAGGDVTQSHDTQFSPTGNTTPGPAPGPAPGGSTPSSSGSSSGSSSSGSAPAPVTVAPPPPAAVTAVPTVGPAGNPLGLPSNSSCIDKRKFGFRLRRPTGAVVDVTVYINGHKTGHTAGANITRLTIAKLPNSGRFRVKIVAISDNGTRLISQRTYRRCTKSRPKGKKVHSHRRRG
jgi:hypothetical protein